MTKHSQYLSLKLVFQITIYMDIGKFKELQKSVLLSHFVESQYLCNLTSAFRNAKYFDDLPSVVSRYTSRRNVDKFIFWLNADMLIFIHTSFVVYVLIFTFIISLLISIMVFWISGIFTSCCIDFITSVDFDKHPAIRSCEAWAFICISTLLKLALAVCILVTAFRALTTSRAKICKYINKNATAHYLAPPPCW